MCGESVRVSRRELEDELVKLSLWSRASKTVSHVAPGGNGVGVETGRYWVKAYEAARPEACGAVGGFRACSVAGGWSVRPLGG